MVTFDPIAHGIAFAEIGVDTRSSAANPCCNLHGGVFGVVLSLGGGVLRMIALIAERYVPSCAAAEMLISMRGRNLHGRERL